MRFFEGFYGGMFLKASIIYCSESSAWELDIISVTDFGKKYPYFSETFQTEKEAVSAMHKRCGYNWREVGRLE